MAAKKRKAKKKPYRRPAGLTPAQRRNELARKRGYASYAQERLAKGIAKGRTPEQARGRSKSQQKTIRSPQARKAVEKRIRAKQRKGEPIQRYDFKGVPSKVRDDLLRDLMKKWSRRRNPIAIAYVEQVEKSKAYPSGYRQEQFFLWGEDESSQAEFESLVSEGRIASVFAWPQ